MITDNDICWPEGRYPDNDAIDGYQVSTFGDIQATAAPGTYPVPSGRGRWRVVVLDRDFTYGGQGWGSTAKGEIADARSRQLEQTWNGTAKFTFSVEGHSQAAAEIRELMSDILVLRWDDQTGQDRPMFRGIVSQAQDTLSEQAHTINFACQDYSAMLYVRLLTTTRIFTQNDQDTIASILTNYGTNTVNSSSGTSFAPGSYIPLVIQRTMPDGSLRAMASGVIRDRTYPANTVVGEAIEKLGAVDGGFDWSVDPFGGGTRDLLRIWYPYQGMSRSTPALVYGSTVSSVSRSVNSADYGNYIRVVGNNGSSDPAAAQLYSERWNTDANNVTVVPVGTWMRAVNASDVSLQGTLNEMAAGQLALSGILVPTYSLGLRPGFYSFGNPNMGDVVPLVIRSGRLDVNTTVRIIGITYDIGDDGQEDVKLTVGRPALTLPQLLQQSRSDLNALARR